VGGEAILLDSIGTGVLSILRTNAQTHLQMWVHRARVVVQENMGVFPLLQGPIVNDLGAMPPSNSSMALDEFESLLDSIPHLKVMTISPHLEALGGHCRIKALLERGVVPAMGHDRVATEGEILGALSCCPANKKLHITHLFNVSAFHHRFLYRGGGRGRGRGSACYKMLCCHGVCILLSPLKHDC